MCIFIHVQMGINIINQMWVTMHTDMVHKRIDITLHPEDIAKLDRMKDSRGYKRSAMIAKLIQEAPEPKKHKGK